MECVEPQLPQSPHGFCDLQLKPEPLRIANRTESASSGDTCVDDPSVPDVDVETSPAQDVPIDTSAVKDARIDEEVSQVLDQDSAAVAQETVAPPDATHSLRTTTSPRLSALMSRFETFETMVRPEPGNPILTGSPSSKLPLPRPALAPLDPNLAAAATPQNGTIGALDGHCNSSRDVKPSATPQKPPKIAQPWSSGQKASTRPAPAVQSVSERRKMFERLSGLYSSAVLRRHLDRLLINHHRRRHPRSTCCRSSNSPHHKAHRSRHWPGVCPSHLHSQQPPTSAQSKGMRFQQANLAAKLTTPPSPTRGQRTLVSRRPEGEAVPTAQQPHGCGSAKGV